MTPTLATRLADLPADYWVEATCPCSKDGPRGWQVGRLRVARPSFVSLGDLMARSRCVRCGGRPTGLAVTDTERPAWWDLGKPKPAVCWVVAEG